MMMIFYERTYNRGDRTCRKTLPFETEEKRIPHALSYIHALLQGFFTLDARARCLSTILAVNTLFSEYSYHYSGTVLVPEYKVLKSLAYPGSECNTILCRLRRTSFPWSSQGPRSQAVSPLSLREGERMRDPGNEVGLR